MYHYNVILMYVLFNRNIVRKSLAISKLYLISNYCERMYVGMKLLRSIALIKVLSDYEREVSLFAHFVVKMTSKFDLSNYCKKENIGAGGGYRIVSR